MKIVNAREAAKKFKENFPSYGCSVSRDSASLKLSRCSNNKDLAIDFSHLPGSEDHSSGLIWGFGPEPEDLNLLRIPANSSSDLLVTALVANELRYIFEVVLELKFDSRFSEDENWYLNMIIASASFAAHMLGISKEFAANQEPSDDQVRRGMLAINTLDRYAKSISRMYEQIQSTFVPGSESIANQIVLLYAALAGSTSQSEIVSNSQSGYSPDWDFDLPSVLEELTQIFHTYTFEPSIYSYSVDGRTENCGGFEAIRLDSSRSNYLNEGGLWVNHEESDVSGELTRVGQIALISESSSLHAMTVFVGLEALNLKDMIESAPKYSKNTKEIVADFKRAKDFIASVLSGTNFVLDTNSFAQAKIMLEMLNE